MVDINSLRQPTILLKVVEIVLLIIVIATFFSLLNGWGLYVCSIILGSFINTIALLALYLMGYTEIQRTPLEAVLYAYYGLGLFISSILLMSTSYPAWIASGVFCLFLTVVYGLDAYFSIVGMRSRPMPFLPNMQPPVEVGAAAPSNIIIPETLNPSVLPVTYPEPTITQASAYHSNPFGMRSVDTNRPELAPSSIVETNPGYQPDTLAFHLFSSVLVAAHLISSLLVAAHLISNLLVAAHLISSLLVAAHLISNLLVAAHLINNLLVAAHLISSLLVAAHLISSVLVAAHLISSVLVAAHLISSLLVAAHLISNLMVAAHLISSLLVAAHLISSLLEASNPQAHLVWVHKGQRHLLQHCILYRVKIFINLEVSLN